MKINFVGIAGCILLFISILFPWYTLSIYGSLSSSSKAQIYLYQTTTFESSLFGGSEAKTEQPYLTTWLVFAFIIVVSVLALLGSLTWRSTLLWFSGIFAIISIVLFVIFMSMSLQSGIGLFSSGTISGGTYSSYLDVGFWLALVGTILLFSSLAVRSKPKVATYQQQYAPQQQIKRICPRCNLWIYEDTKICPRCGQPLSITEK